MTKTPACHTCTRAPVHLLCSRAQDLSSVRRLHLPFRHGLDREGAHLADPTRTVHLSSPAAELDEKQDGGGCQKVKLLLPVEHLLPLERLSLVCEQTFTVSIFGRAAARGTFQPPPPPPRPPTGDQISRRAHRRAAGSSLRL